MANGVVTRETIRAAFDAAYTANFSRLLPSPVKLVNVRTAAVGHRPDFDFSVLAPPSTASIESAKRKPRKIWFNDKAHDAAIWSRAALPVGAKVEGPAVLEQPDATVFLEPGFAATVDKWGNVIIERAST
jgi:N-methylhydantoinase A